MTFVPSRTAISAITQANPCVVTTSSPHNLSTGQIVKMNVPVNFGMYPLNNRNFSVTVLTNITFSLQISQVPPSINVDSTLFPPFTIPSNPRFTAEVLPVGSGPTPIRNTASELVNNVCDTLLGDAMQNIATVNQPF